MIDLRRLGYLVVLAKRLSYSRAAMDVGLSQSALSRSIQSLEQDIGMRLFDRDQSGVRLTEQGRWVVAKAEVLLTNATDFTNQLAFAAMGAEGRIRIGMTAISAHLLLPAILPARLAKTPRFAHEILIREVESLYLMLAQGEIEFLICSELQTVWSIPDVMPIKITSLGTLPISLIVRRGHPLLDGGECEAGFPILVASMEVTLGKVSAMVRDRMGVSIQVVEDIGLLSALVLESDAIWITCPHVLRGRLDSDRFYEIPLPDGVEPRAFELFVYSLARRSTSPAATELLKRFSDHFT